MCIAFAVGSVGCIQLDSRYRCRGAAYLDAIGEAVHTLCPAIPNGTVVFLPSYGLVETLLARLRATGRLDTMAAERQIFVEERGETGGKILAMYRAAAVKGQATLFAVMRGKAAEGVDLRDAEARACLVVGVPYAQLAIDVELRRRAPGGARWYEAEAMRQVALEFL